MLKYKIQQNNINYNFTKVEYNEFNMNKEIDGNYYFEFIFNYKPLISNYDRVVISCNDNKLETEVIIMDDFFPSSDNQYSIFVKKPTLFEITAIGIDITTINDVNYISLITNNDLNLNDVILVESSFFIDSDIFSCEMKVVSQQTNNVFLCTVIDDNDGTKMDIINDNQLLMTFNKADNRFNVNSVLYKIGGVINVPLTLSTDFANNLFQTELVTKNFFDVEKKKAINPIVDMEKDIYFPVYVKGSDKLIDSSGNIVYQNFSSIEEIEFNLHFRERDLNNGWKVYDDGYWNGINSNGVSDKRLVPFDNPENQSDLLGYLNFNNDDVFYQKSKLAKSFIRLSYYDSPNPSNQMLLYYSTIFMDEGLKYSTYIKNITLGEGVNDYYNFKFKDLESEISTDGEYQQGNNDEERETKRLSSRIKVSNKYESKGSSEGFYLYFFKENGELLHERTIYLKIEFNHAGYGRTIPFMMPMEQISGSSLYKLLKYTDSNFPFNGYPINELYEKMFIPIRLVYDYPNNRYVYYLPTDDIQNNKLVYNLFEIKVEE